MLVVFVRKLSYLVQRICVYHVIMTSDVDVLLFLSHWCCVGKGGKEGGGHLGSMISALFARRRLGALRAAPDRAGSNSPSLDIRGKTKKGQVD